MKKFSLFLPSRERPELLKDCIWSIFKKCKEVYRTEAAIILDDDDFSFDKYLGRDLKDVSISDWDVRFYRVRRSDRPTRDYLNFACKHLTGDYIWGLNDDVEMVTEEWDRIMEEKIEAFLSDKPNRMAYIHMDDSSHIGENAEKMGCCFPLITRELYEKLGCYMPDEIATWGADTALYDIVKQAGIPILRIPEVVLKHKCHHNGTRDRDAVNVHVQAISEKRGALDRDAIIGRYVERLKS